MAKLTNTGTFNNASFGQYGCIFTDNASAAIEPPTGKVFVAITMLSDTTFDNTSGLVSEQASLYANTASAAGTGGVTIVDSDTFPKGVTIYGRWTSVNLAGGSVIAYIGE
tara:strand:- start:380 stop:709 length:330 start_codon:yes stop_codon:yes gene_type:complete